MLILYYTILESLIDMIISKKHNKQQNNDYYIMILWVIAFLVMTLCLFYMTAHENHI